MRAPSPSAALAAVLAAGALLAATHPASHAGAGAKSRPADAHAAVVRAEIIAGTPQTVHAYASPSEPKYVADFPVQLAVRIVGGKSRAGKRRVKFQCVNPNCALFAPEQPEGGDRQSPSDYEIDAKDGKASLHVSIESNVPAGAYVVYVEPIAKPGERSVRSGPFTLGSR